MLSPDKTKSVEFVSDQYDDLIAFKVSANEELKEIRARLDKISETCDSIQKSLDAFELYSYQFNIKIVGMPMVAEREHPEQSASLCLYTEGREGVKWELGLALLWTGKMGFTHWDWDLATGNGISFLQRSLLQYFEIEK